MQQAAHRIWDNGRIINIGTMLLGATTRLYSVYAGSKAPLEHFTRAPAKEIGGRGVISAREEPGAGSRFQGRAGAARGSRSGIALERKFHAKADENAAGDTVQTRPYAATAQPVTKAVRQ
jgi:NAD(P)-dependent dehydrogenase (short-subunit alcohol dehydrogenase family)